LCGAYNVRLPPRHEESLLVASPNDDQGQRRPGRRMLAMRKAPARGAASRP